MIGGVFAAAGAAGVAAVCGGLRDGATAAVATPAFAPEAGATAGFAATGRAAGFAAGFGGGVEGALLLASLAAGFDELFAAVGRAFGDFAATFFKLAFGVPDFAAVFDAARFFATIFFGAIFLTAFFFEAADFDAETAGRFFAALAAAFVRDFVTLLRATRRLLVRAGLAPGGSPFITSRDDSGFRQ